MIKGYDGITDLDWRIFSKQIPILIR